MSAAYDPPTVVATFKGSPSTRRPRKDTGILFKAEMVKAILAGTKTQTRRILDPQPPADFVPIEVGRYCPMVIRKSGEAEPGPEVFGASDEDRGYVCRQGGPGDHLWVRETWRPKQLSLGEDNFAISVDYAAGGKQLVFGDHAIPEQWTIPKAAKTGNVTPLFMPRWASRISLEILSVRLERLHTISNADIAAEGVTYESVAAASHLDPVILRSWANRDDLWRLWRHTWTAINGDHSWVSNPWIWAIAFCRLLPIEEL